MIRLPNWSKRLFNVDNIACSGTLLNKAIITFLIILTCGCHLLFGQVNFGVSWEPPEDTVEFRRQLEALKQMNITYLQLPPSLDRTQREVLQRYDFDVFIKPAYKYLISRKLIRRKDSIRDSLAGIIKSYNRYEPVKAIGLIASSLTTQDSFRQHFIPLTKDWKRLSDKPLFISMGLEQEQTVIPIDFMQYELSHASDTLSPGKLSMGKSFLYKPVDYSTFDQKSFRNILELAKYEQTPNILFIPFSWLAERLKEGDKIVGIIENYSHAADAVFAVNDKPPETKENSGLILLFILLIGSTAVHYHYNGTYQRLLFRYFTTHAFFVNDIAEWRIRTGTPGFVIMIQHAIAGGIILQILGEYVISPTGWDVLIHYFHPLNYIYASLPILSLYSSLGVFAVELLAVFWIYLTNRSIKHINQVLLLYGWPLQLNIIVSGAVLTIYQANGWEGYILLLTGAYIAIWLFAYLATIMDLNSYTQQKKELFLSLTLGVGTVVLGGIAYYIVQIGGLQIFQLALALQ